MFSSTAAVDMSFLSKQTQAPTAKKTSTPTASKLSSQRNKSFSSQPPLLEDKGLKQGGRAPSILQTNRLSISDQANKDKPTLGKIGKWLTQGVNLNKGSFSKSAT